MADQQEKESKNGTQKSQTPALEWLAAAIGLILVAGTIGFLIYNAVTETRKPPQMIVRADEIINVENGWLVKFTLENTGDRHAADIVVEGKIAPAGQEAETSSVTLDYAPSHSERKGGLFFRQNPQNADLRLRALGYNEP